MLPSAAVTLATSDADAGQASVAAPAAPATANERRPSEVRFAELPADRPRDEQAAINSLALDAVPAGWAVLDQVLTDDIRGNGLVSYIQLGELTEASEGGSIVVSATVFGTREQARTTWKEEQRLLKGAASQADGEE